MLGWIKKRCRRRSDTAGGREKYDGELSQVKPRVSDCPVYFTIDVTYPSSNNYGSNIDDHVYEEVDVTETYASYDTIREITSLTKRMEDEFGCKENICPLCRCKIEQPCACVDFVSYDTATAIHEPPIYELAHNPFCQNDRRRSLGYKGANRPLPNLPWESPVKPNTIS
ncbi:hypothetical protein SNE40_019273 [Patella caerulea]|uniref:Uncharacterized protein n=1 Tax=Patella caerulea TaxID=87958 RepID=A0AAN8J6V4_PATCE